MIRNYLKGAIGDEINVMMAAAAMNFKRVMNLWKTEAIISLKLFFKILMNVYLKFYACKLKMTF
jgi:IS5 family transposase